MLTAYKFRMYPNKQQEAMLDLTLETCRHLYNTALADRKNCYELEGISRSYEDQAATLTLEKKGGKWQIFSQVSQDVLKRVDKAFKAFFRRVKSGEKPGYPRFKGKGWYKSFTYLQAAQRDLSRKKKGSANRRKAKIKVAKIHQRVTNLRNEFLHVVSHELVETADHIVFENLNI